MVTAHIYQVGSHIFGLSTWNEQKHGHEINHKGNAHECKTYIWCFVVTWLELYRIVQHKYLYLNCCYSSMSVINAIKVYTAYIIPDGIK